MFKGGACLRKCHHDASRFLEDIDFTVIDGGPEDPGDLAKVWRACECRARKGPP